MCNVGLLDYVGFFYIIDVKVLGEPFNNFAIQAATAGGLQMVNENAFCLERFLEATGLVPAGKLTVMRFGGETHGTRQGEAASL
jgi:hypothetical protein